LGDRLAQKAIRSRRKSSSSRSLLTAGKTEDWGPLQKVWGNPRVRSESCLKSLVLLKLKKELRVKKKKLLQKPQLVFFKQKKASQFLLLSGLKEPQRLATKRRNSQLSVNSPYTRPQLNINKRRRK